MNSRRYITIYIVRHGETDFNLQGRFQGSFDSELNEAGRAQALKLAETLRDVRFSAVYSSPLSRAFETAKVILQEASLTSDDRQMPFGNEREIVVMDGLKELDYGEWQGLLPDEREKMYPGLDQAWSSDPWSVQIPGAESLADMKRRVYATLDLILASHGPGESLLVSAHGHVNRIILMRLLKLSEADFLDIVQQNGQCQKLIWDIRGTVLDNTILN